MLNDDNVLTIYDHYEGWTMTMDLNVLVNEVGKKTKAEKWQDPKTGVWYQEPPRVMFPLPQAKRAMRLILRYCLPEEVDRIDEIFRKNPKLYDAWTKERRSRA